jgi:hypothetical protein
MCDDTHATEEFYVQKFGNKRIIQVRGWSNDNALLYDLKSELEYTMAWDVFFMHHEKLQPAEVDTSDYQGANLDLKDE